MAEGELNSGSARRAVDVTSRFINSSRLNRLSSAGPLAKSTSVARLGTANVIKITARNSIADAGEEQLLLVLNRGKNEVFEGQMSVGGSEAAIIPSRTFFINSSGATAL